MNSYHFQEHHLMLREEVRKMAERHVAPIAAEIDENDRFPEELVEIFGDMGLLQLWVPEEYGGPGGDLTSVCIVKEEIAKFSESAALLAANNSIGLILPILNFGSEEQKRHFLGIGQHFFVAARAPADDIAYRGEQVAENIGADHGFSGNHAQVSADLAAVDVRCGGDDHGSIAPALMSEMAHAGEYHGDTGFVGRSDNLVVTNRTAWLNN